jgi:hypothetical protein
MTELDPVWGYGADVTNNVIMYRRWGTSSDGASVRHPELLWSDKGRDGPIREGRQVGESVKSPVSADRGWPNV